jgi:predicted membrane protein
MITHAMNKPSGDSTRTGVSWAPLICAFSIMIALSIYPGFLVRVDGTVDKLAAYLLFWSMSAGFIRGVGFIPKHKVLAMLFSGPAALTAVVLAVLYPRFF